MGRAATLWVLGAILVGCGDVGETADLGDASGPVDAAGDSDPTSDVGADAEADTKTPPVVAWCEGTTSYRWDPGAGLDLETFPDDFFTVDAPDSPTGLRLRFAQANAPWIPDMPDLLRGAFDDLNALSGFGRNAGAVLRFTAPIAEVPTGADASVTSDALMLLDLDTQPPTRVPYEASLGDDGRDLVLWPLRPFRPGARHALVATTALAAADGGCVAPSAALRAVLTGQADDPALERLQGRYADLLASTGLEPAEISAAAVFTTHSDLDVIYDAAADVRTRDYAWLAPPTCEKQGDRYRCEGSFTAYDYRDGRHIATPTPSAPWELPVSVWLPAEGEGPFPVVLAAHGIGHHRGYGAAVASLLVPEGFAVVAADAMEHGDHPTNEPDQRELDSMKFLGLNLEALAVDALALRGNFNQTLLDRLQLIELIRQAPDVDGDGAPDLDVTRLAYHGTSLGGMMGAPLLAASDDIGAAVLTVAGGRLLVFATDTAPVKAFKDLLIGLVGSEALFERLLVVAQTVVDAADPATFGAHVLSDRRVGTDPPDLLFPVAIADETVPPAAGKALARALGIPHVGVVRDPVALLPLEPALPTSANIASGASTAGFFQYDRVGGPDASTPATHDNTPFSPECQLQSRHFLSTWLDTGTAELLDPYDVLATPSLP